MDMEDRIAEGAETASTIGTVRIASDVVATIAGMAAANIAGIAGMSGGVAGGIAQMLGSKSLTKGVKVELDEQSAVIDLFVIIEYGISIADVARKVQESVKNTVESMTSLVCTAVNIHVQGITFPQAENTEVK